MRLVIVIILLSLGIECRGLSLEERWELWKLEHKKSYDTAGEEEARQHIWSRTYHRIARHNHAEERYYLAMNQFSDLTDEEHITTFLETVETESHKRSMTLYSTSNQTEQELDWRKRGFVSHVARQGNMCKSSWAFSAAGALEGLHKKLKGQLLSLSAQQLIDCSDTYGNKGCEGGTVQNAFQYVHEDGGLCSNSSYPYLGYGWQCVSKFCEKVATCLGYVDVSDGDEYDLLNAVYTLGPVSIMVDASSYTFRYYKGGIYYCNSGCSKTSLNQAMLVVGYGYDSYADEHYWILKNSWGITWGEDGYMRIARNRNNTCGVATFANYPIVIYT